MKYKLNDIDKNQKFKVPEGYFEDLPLKIQKRIDQEKTSKSGIQLPVWSLAMAASFVVVLAFVFIFNSPNPSAEQLLSDIPQEELMAYLDQIEIDEYELVVAFPDEANSLEFEDIGILNGLEFEDQSLEDILKEYNLEDESLEI